MDNSLDDYNSNEPQDDSQNELSETQHSMSASEETNAPDGLTSHSAAADHSPASVATSDGDDGDDAETVSAAEFASDASESGLSEASGRVVGDQIVGDEAAGSENSGGTVSGDTVSRDAVSGGSLSNEAALDDPKSAELSPEFVGRWSNLISTTNWEKGKIICEWRDALMGSEAPASTYSDEAWAARVGGVTSQHIGRLRRVSQRFGETHETYPSLYWSHFWAALDWDDAEMWLEGASQSGWSISQMRRTRWEAMGGDPASKPKESEITSVSDDEDFTPLSEVDDETGTQDGPRSVAEGPRPDGPDFGDEDYSNGETDRLADANEDSAPWEDDETKAEPADSPFATLPSLPVDLAESVEQFKLAIIRHRASTWSEISQDDVLKALEALKIFTLQ